MEPLSMDELLVNSSSMNGSAANSAGKSGKSNKKFFSFGKKKPKRKPVCTCHLYMNGGSAYGPYGEGSTIGALHNGINVPYSGHSSKPFQMELAPPSEFVNSPSPTPALSSSLSPHRSAHPPNGDLLSSPQCNPTTPKYYPTSSQPHQTNRYPPPHQQQPHPSSHPSYHPSVSISPRHYNTTSSSINQHGQQTPYMEGVMPSSNQTNSRLDDFIGTRPTREQTYYGNSNGTNGRIAQEYCGPSVVQSMTNLSIGERGGTPHHHHHHHQQQQPHGHQSQWESSGRASASAQLAYQLELASSSSRQYRKMFIQGHGSLGNEQFSASSPSHQQQHHQQHHKSAKDDLMTGIYGTPDLGSIYRRQQRQQQLMIEPAPPPQQQQASSMDQMALVPYNRQRRWSDGNPSKFSKTDADSYREEQQNISQMNNAELYLKTMSPDPKGYIPNCTCSKCVRHTRSRPKVSFGPSMMYEPGDPATSSSNPYDPSLPYDPNDPSKKPPWSKLTTELLPLDTQIPLQMMSDSALVCNII